MIKRVLNSLSLLIFIALLTFTSCNKDEKVDITKQTVFYEDDYLSFCYLFNSTIENEEVVIRDNESYQTLRTSLTNPTGDLICDTLILPNIDFRKYILIGKATTKGGCNAKNEKKILVDYNDQTITYQIYHEYINICSAAWSSMNWALVPITDKNYTVSFSVEIKIVPPYK